MKRKEALAYRAQIVSAAELQDDEKALESIWMYPAWAAGLSVLVGVRYRYNDVLYKCVQAHTTQIGWEPDKTPALWTVVSLDEWPEWKQPTGAQDAYMKDDKVSHNDQHWISLINSNVWEPGAVGTESLWAVVN